MTQYLVKISSQGQMTLPAKERKRFPQRQFLLEVHEHSFILKPVEMKIVGQEDELQNFGSLAAKSFDFWDDDEDDIYQSFYSLQ